MSAWQAILQQMDDVGQIDFSETFADGSFASAKKEVEVLARLVVAKALRSCFRRLSRAPVAIETESASCSEVKLIEPLLAKITLQNRQPERLVYDKAADSNALRKRLSEKKIDLICPHRKSSVKPPTLDC